MALASSLKYNSAFTIYWFLLFWCNNLIATSILDAENTNVTYEMNCWAISLAKTKIKTNDNCVNEKENGYFPAIYNDFK